jgi:hypothetical protein
MIKVKMKMTVKMKVKVSVGVGRPVCRSLLSRAGLHGVQVLLQGDAV